MDEKSRTAHAVMTKRSVALIVYKMYRENGFPKEFGPNCQVEPIYGVKDDEIEDSSREFRLFKLFKAKKAPPI
jgi:hypothetical protein